MSKDKSDSLHAQGLAFMKEAALFIVKNKTDAGDDVSPAEVIGLCVQVLAAINEDIADKAASKNK